MSGSTRKVDHFPISSHFEKHLGLPRTESHDIFMGCVLVDARSCLILRSMTCCYLLDISGNDSHFDMENHHVHRSIMELPSGKHTKNNGT